MRHFLRDIGKREGAWIREEIKPFPARITWMLDHWVVIITLIGGASYATLRAAYSEFYAQLNLRPEEVGLGYAEVLAQTLASLILIGLLIFLAVLLAMPLLFVAATLFDYVTDIPVYLLIRFVRKSHRYRFGQYGGNAVIAIAFILMTEVIDLYALHHQVNLAFAISATSIVLLMILVDMRRHQRIRLHRVAGLTTAITLGVVLGNAVVWLILMAHDDGQAVRRGEERHPIVVGLTLASWGGDRAQLASDAPADVRALNGDGLMYLGQTSETAILFDRKTGGSIRVPVRAVTVLVQR